uniref:Dipeptidylpeptidase IV N-terminal domain-containing protein n=1 Tax=candidate division CPR3 bacterium TaxID=2268181 RepID=A0A7C4M531_UNCC3
MFKRKIIYSGFNNYSNIKKWFYVVSILVFIAVIWMAYFVFKSYSSDGNIRISGQIYSGDKNVIAASVSIGEESVVTDENGEYFLSNLNFGKNTIKITKNGYKEKNQSIFIWKDGQKIKKIEIDKDENLSISFSGVVIDGFNKKPISGAIVELGPSNATTSDRGEFSFFDIPKDILKIKVSAIGYVDLEEEINISSNENDFKEISLTPYGRISFTTSRDGKRNIYAINYDGKNIRNLTGGIKEDCWGGKYTVDGKRLVFFSSSEKDIDIWGQKIPALYVLNKNGVEPFKISGDLIVEGDFKISKSGERVVFVGRDNNEGKSEIYITSIGEKRDWIQLTDNSSIESNIDISPDGNWIVFGVLSEDSQRIVKAVNIFSREEKNIFTSPSREYFISFSPDGKKLIYAKEGMDFYTRLFTFDLEESKEKEIYKTSSGLKNILWSSDSKKIIFTSTRDDRTDIYSIDVDGKNEVKLTEKSGQYDNVIWPSLEKILVFSIRKDEGYVLAVMDLSSRKIYEIEKIGNDILSWDPQVFDTNQVKDL